jgi:tetratricopeptide (TPR) repeat protein
VRNTREKLLERDGDVQASRFCAGCHDLVPFFSGAFDDPKFDDVSDPTAKAGITCTGCHAITHVNSQRGNSDYTIEEPVHYPFAFSESPFLRWVNRQLVKAKPEFHKKTFLKPLHKTAEFCGVCHKVHLPEQLNHYRWLRGQNHYDSFLLSGVSGHGASSFYYPPKAEESCNRCHMPLEASDDFGARQRDDSGLLKVHDHMFPSANTAVAKLVGMPETVIDAHQKFNDGVMRVDIFGLREGGTVDGDLHAPLRPAVPALEPGKRYLLETVIRTLKMGHHFTQGTTDSNEVWLEVQATSGDQPIGVSGAMDPKDATVDPWAYFVNAYVLDRNGGHVEKRNAEDIFVALYNHQIPPGAADVVHYALDVPEHLSGPVTVKVRLLYRKFTTSYMRGFQGKDFRGNDLPVMVLAQDSVTFPLAGGGPVVNPPSAVPAWQRWNDYGIGLLRAGSEGAAKGLLRQAEEAFTQVAKLGRADGPLNLARVYFKEGRVDDAGEALRRAAEADPPAPPWTVTWLTGLVNEQNGYLDAAIENFSAVVDTRFPDARARGFDFSKDYRVLNELGQALFERAQQERGDARKTAREGFLKRARETFQAALSIDPENATAHYNMALVCAQLGETALAEQHRALHARYKVDDNARDRVFAIQRARNPAADHAANSVVIYDLSRASQARQAAQGQALISTASQHGGSHID